MTASSPFGRFAGAVAAVAALAILAVWLAGAAGVAGIQPTEQLNAAGYIVLGAIFGTGAGALVVANGAGRQAQVANTRLDAMNAPGSAIAKERVAVAAAATVAANHTPDQTILGPTDD